MKGKLTKQEITVRVYCSLISNPERYKYIAQKVEKGELTQDEATAKNVKKAKIMADALYKEL